MNIKKIKALRESKGYTHAEMGRMLGISQPYYTYIEQGLKVPTLPILKRLAEILGCKVDDLLLN